MNMYIYQACDTVLKTYHCAGKSKSRTEGLVRSRTHGLFTSTHSQKSALYFVWQMASALAYNIAHVVG